MAQLDYLMFETPQLDKVQAFYSEQMGFDVLSLESDVVLLEGPQRRLIFMQGSQARLLEIGFAVASPQHLLLGQQRLQALPGFVEVQWPLFQQSAYCVHDPQGLRLVFGLQAQPAIGAPGVLPARLQHLGLGTNNVAAMRRFYFEQLGFLLSDEVFGDDKSLRSIFVRSSPEHHCIAVFGNGKPGFDHLSFEVPNWNGIRDWADRFAQFGTLQHWGPGRHGVGNNLFLFVLDPDGRMVEVSAELEHLPNDHTPGHWAFDYKAYNLWGSAALRV
jgi:catechol 2,3-dioxygenase